jgi:type I restriction enzyme S subunit
MKVNWTKLGSFGECIRGVSYSKNQLFNSYDDHSTVLFRANNIVNDHILLEDLQFVDNKKVSRKQSIKRNDIIICMSSGSKHLLGKAAQFKIDDDKRYTVGAFCSIFRPNPGINPKYMKYFFQSKIYKNRVLKVSTATNINNLKKVDIDNIQMPLLSDKDEQTYIPLLERAEQLREKRQKANEETNTIIQSIFYDMFGDPGKNSKKWELKTLPDLVRNTKNSIKRGPFGGSLTKSMFVDKGYLVYEQYHAINDDFSMARYFIDERKYNEMEMFKVLPGDLLISCSGVTLGRIAEVPMNALPGIINQALLKLTLDQDKANNTYFKTLFRSPYTQKMIFGVSRGSGIPNFPSMSVIKALKFPTPPIELQNEFAERVKKIESLREKQKKSTEEINTLFDALMQKAFKGELAH